MLSVITFYVVQMREEAAAVEARAADAATAREALRLTEGSAGADAKNAYKELKAASQRQASDLKANPLAGMRLENKFPH